MKAQTTDKALDQRSRSADWAFKQLLKLESDCRSTTLATQIQAVGQFSKLLDQFPFPTLVGSACLKLLDLFRTSSNTLRYHITQVFETAQHHLPQISHTKELLKRTLVVLYSNDPTARVLALRLLGNASIIFAKYPEAQHGVLLRYQSSDPLEIAAAVQTTQSILVYCPAYLNVVWETVIAKANDTSLSDSVRYQLVSSLSSAESSLQLSKLLYGHCRIWINDPSSSTEIKVAAMATWKASIQVHNELQDSDARLLSGYLQHEAERLRKGALMLLSKWRPSAQENAYMDAVSSDDMDDTDYIKKALIKYVETQHEETMFGTPTAILALARIEAEDPQINGNAVSLDAAHKISKIGLGVYKGDTASSFLPLSPLRQFLLGTMLVVRAASILKQPEHILLASQTIADAWLVLSKRSIGGEDDSHVKRFLSSTWIWCKQTSSDARLVESLADMLGSPNRRILLAMLTLVVKKRIAIGDDMLLTRCSEAIERVIEILKSSSNEILETAAEYRLQAWNAVAVFLTKHLHGHLPASDTDPAKMVEMWTEKMEQVDGSSCLWFYGNTGPPSGLFLKLMVLLASCGYWRPLSSMCRAASLCSNCDKASLHDRLYAIRTLAEAEEMRSNGDRDQYWVLIESSLSTWRMLNNRSGGRHLYQVFIVQLFKGFAELIGEWQALQLSSPIKPPLIVVVRTLIDQAYELARQATLVTRSFLLIDRVTMCWLDDVQTTLEAIITIFGHAEGNVRPEAMEQICTDVQKVLLSKQVNCSLRLGSSFFTTLPVPDISIQIRPNLKSTEPTLTVPSGSQFNIVVEGFLRMSSQLRQISPHSMRVAAWISRNPRYGPTDDLGTCAKYQNIANNKLANSSFEWDSATTFETQFVDDYFACSCALLMPTLETLIGHFDTTIAVYVHVMCALVDDEKQSWWVGPHQSWLLKVSTTAKV